MLNPIVTQIKLQYNKVVSDNSKVGGIIGSITIANPPSPPK